MKIWQKMKFAVVGLAAVAALGLGYVASPVYAEVKCGDNCECASDDNSDSDNDVNAARTSCLTTKGRCEAITNVADRANCYATLANGGSTTSLMETLQTVINVILGVIGFVAVVMLVYGGIQYIVSAGDAAKVKKAKDTILYGIVGLIVALLAAAIVNFVLVNVFKSGS